MSATITNHDGVDPYADLRARLDARWALRDRRRREQSGLQSLPGIIDAIEAVHGGEGAPGLWAIVRANSAAAKRDQRTYWLIPDWQAFCEAARDDARNQSFADGHGVLSRLLGTALVRTVRNVERMIADGKSSHEIWRALHFLAEREASALEAQRKRDEQQRRAMAEREASKKSGSRRRVGSNEPLSADAEYTPAVEI